MNDNIFSGLKVVDFASFIAGPSAAVILSDFGADVIKVEPPTGDMWRIGHKIPPQPQAQDPYPFHLANRNKRGITLDLKSTSARQVLERLVGWADVLIVNTPHPARTRLQLEYDDVAPWNPRLIYADVTGFGDKGPDANLPGFDITSFWARSGLLSMTRDAGQPPTWPVAGSGDNVTAVGLYAAIVTALYRRERTGKGSYVTTSLLAEGVWSASVSIQAALCEAKFYGLHDRENPANAALNVYRASDGTWFVLIVTPDKLAAVAKAIGRADLLTDPRFSDPAKLIQNMAQLTATLDDVFGAQPMTHWYEVFNGVHVTFGAVRGPQEVVKDPQLRLNDIIVPLEGAGGKLTSTISSPIQVHGVTKVPAKRAPEIGEHNEEILEQLGFSATEIEGFRASRTIPGIEHFEGVPSGGSPDVLQRKGQYDPPAGASDIPGLEISGEVVALGSETSRFAAGDKVSALIPGGGYADYAVADERTTLHLPVGLDMVEAAALPESFMTVWVNLFQRGGFKRGETVLIHGGASGIGTTATMLAKAFGAKTIITTVANAEQRQASLGLGADVAVNYQEEDFIEEVMKATDAKGVDVIVDIIAGDYVARNFQAAAMNGRIVQIGVIKGAARELDFFPMLAKRLTHSGSTLRSRSADDKAQIIGELEAQVWPLIRAGQLKPLIHETFALDEANRAHELIDSGLHIGKIVLKTREGLTAFLEKRKPDFTKSREPATAK